ncbi:MAG: hypothetical protein H7245_07245 [Candidatus Saccharibacteria bacterium]|nr:hypothetical protein [Pseudorhodobacter sp.]
MLGYIPNDCGDGVMMGGTNAFALYTTDSRTLMLDLDAAEGDGLHRLGAQVAQQIVGDYATVRGGCIRAAVPRPACADLPALRPWPAK